MRLSALCLLAALASVPALAGDVPDLTGTWTPQNDVSARVGVNPGITEPVQAPTLNASAAAFGVRIDTHEGRAFHGRSIAPNGKTQVLVGVFNRDGTRFHVSSETGAAIGEMIEGGGFELCWTDAVVGYVAAACTTYAK